MARQNRTIVVAIALSFVWLFVGTIVYRLADNCSPPESCSSTTPVCGWSWQESFYYSVQAGLSIGFGLLPEDEQGSQLYTVFHIMLGSSVIGGALSLLVSLAIARNKDYQDTCERQLHAYKLKVSTEGYPGFETHELRQLMITHPIIYHDILARVESDGAVVSQKVETFKAAPAKARAPLVDALMSDAIEKVDEMKGGKLTVDDLTKIHNEERPLGTKVKDFVMNRFAFISVWMLLFVWLLVGLIFGLCEEKWSFITSLFFAVSTLSTAGLQGVTRTPDGSHVLFAGIFSLIGVPLYAAALGTMASWLSDKYTEKEFDDALHSKMEARDVAFVENLLAAEQTETLDLAEFTNIEMLRLGLVDRDCLKQIKDKFQKLDKENTGSVRIQDCLANDQKRIARVKSSL